MVQTTIATHPEPGQLVYRQSIWTRVTHWVWATCLFFLLLTGLQIFNAHPTLNLGLESGFEYDNALLEIGARDTPTGPQGRPVTRSPGQQLEHELQAVLVVPLLAAAAEAQPGDHRQGRSVIGCNRCVEVPDGMLAAGPGDQRVRGLCRVPAAPVRLEDRVAELEGTGSAGAVHSRRPVEACVPGEGADGAARRNDHAAHPLGSARIGLLLRESSEGSVAPH